MVEVKDLHNKVEIAPQNGNLYGAMCEYHNWHLTGGQHARSGAHT